MNYSDLIEEFKKILKERYPGRYNYVPELAEILEVHPKTVFRKLRGDTHFTLEEAVKIFRALDISFDRLFVCGPHTVKHPMEIYLHDFSLPKEYEYVAQITLQSHTFAAQSSNSLYLVATNTVPDLVYAGHEWIAKFCYIKWLYFNKGADAMIPLSDIHLSNSDKEVHRNYQDAIFAMKRSIYIFHIDMMKNIVEEISFFYQTNYITKEETKLIIHEYQQTLDEMEDICTSGFLPFNGKEIDIFYSNILLSNDITIIDSDNIKLAIIYAYFLNPIITKSAATFNIIKSWFYSWIRSANIISMSGIDKRQHFFSQQRKELDRVKESL